MLNLSLISGTQTLVRDELSRWVDSKSVDFFELLGATRRARRICRKRPDATLLKLIERSEARLKASAASAGAALDEASSDELLAVLFSRVSDPNPDADALMSTLLDLDEWVCAATEAGRAELVAEVVDEARTALGTFVDATVPLAKAARRFIEEQGIRPEMPEHAIWDDVASSAEFVAQLEQVQPLESVPAWLSAAMDRAIEAAQTQPAPEAIVLHLPRAKQAAAEPARMAADDGSRRGLTPAAVALPIKESPEEGWSLWYEVHYPFPRLCMYVTEGAVPPSLSLLLSNGSRQRAQMTSSGVHVIELKDSLGPWTLRLGGELLEVKVNALDE